MIRAMMVVRYLFPKVESVNVLKLDKIEAYLNERSIISLIDIENILEDRPTLKERIEKTKNLKDGRKC